MMFDLVMKTKSELKREIDLEFWISEVSRDLAIGINPLFHGTRYPLTILKSGKLIPGPCGDVAVCFTRSALVAAYWATLPRDDGEDRGAVFVFDRDRLSTCYQFDTSEHFDVEDDEQEERVWNRSVLLTAGMVGLATQPKTFLGWGRRSKSVKLYP
jgi:hypothetical protein